MINLEDRIQDVSEIINALESKKPVPNKGSTGSMGYAPILRLAIRCDPSCIVIAKFMLAHCILNGIFPRRNISDSTNSS